MDHKQKRILIIYTTAGTGHKKAAFAIKAALDEIARGVSVEIIDSLDYATALFKWLYPRIYIFFVNRIPSLWGLGYYLLDNWFFYGLFSWLRHATNRGNFRRLALYLRKERFDCIITTHFLPPDIVSMEGKRKIPSYLISVITDLRTHSFWIAKGVDMYSVAHEETKRDLISRYFVPEEKIKVLGIPIDPVFSKPKNKDVLKTKLGMDKNLFTVLVGSGGFGVGPVEELIKSFKGINIPAQLIVICGHNDALCLSLKNVQGEMETIPIKPYGYVENMDEFMEAADVIVTKPGGMMSSESLAKNLPIISIAPIPGQESRNARILIRSGVALEARSVNDVPRLVMRLYNDRELRANMAKRIDALKRPAAAYDIARTALDAIK